VKNFRATIVSQYSNSPTLTQMIANFDTCVAPGVDLDLFYVNVWNVLTAVGYGLDCWGRIVGVGRVLTIPVPGSFLGWAEALPGSQPWTQGIWYGGAGQTSNFVLSDSAYRILILAKGLANICDGSIRATNQILINLFGNTFGNAYVNDLGAMQMQFVFSAPLDPVSYAIVTESGVLPVPAGVSATVVQL
jgi:hypothetical protein